MSLFMHGCGSQGDGPHDVEQGRRARGLDTRMCMRISLRVYMNYPPGIDHQATIGQWQGSSGLRPSIRYPIALDCTLLCRTTGG